MNEYEQKLLNQNPTSRALQNVLSKWSVFLRVTEFIESVSLLEVVL